MHRNKNEKINSNKIKFLYNIYEMKDIFFILKQNLYIYFSIINSECVYVCIRREVLFFSSNNENRRKAQENDPE